MTVQPGCSAARHGPRVLTAGREIPQPPEASGYRPADEAVGLHGRGVAGVRVRATSRGALSNERQLPEWAGLQRRVSLCGPVARRGPVRGRRRRRQRWHGGGTSGGTAGGMSGGTRGRNGGRHSGLADGGLTWSSFPLTSFVWASSNRSSLSAASWAPSGTSPASRSSTRASSSAPFKAPTRRESCSCRDVHSPGTALRTSAAAALLELSSRTSRVRNAWARRP